MVTLEERLEAHDSAEARAELLERERYALDERYVQALLPGLAALTARLSGTLLAAGQALSAALRADGARALTEAALPGRTGDPQALAAHSAQDLEASDDPHLLRLAGELRWLSEGAESEEAALRPALISAAEGLADLQAVDAERERLRALEAWVMQAPRARRVSSRTYTVTEGETLADIAEAVLGERERWDELPRLYGLYPPYFSATPRLGAISPGTRLPLPPQSRVLEEEGLGLTFALDVSPGPRGGQDWDLAAQGGAGLASDRGLAAFATDLALRAATPLGSLDGEDNYGVAEVAGLPSTVASVYVQLAATEALREDPRVERLVVDPRGTSSLTGVFVAGVVAVPRPELLGE